MSGLCGLEASFDGAAANPQESSLWHVCMRVRPSPRYVTVPHRATNYRIVLLLGVLPGERLSEGILVQRCRSNFVYVLSSASAHRTLCTADFDTSAALL
jgi:hypothetical protein